MSNGVKFYMQKYPQSGTSFSREDIEATYNCIYRQFEGLEFSGDIKNIYEEDFTEADGTRRFIPEPEELAHSEVECKLQLLFHRSTCAEDSEAFYAAYCGQYCEYHDTFRKKYAKLLMIKRPTIKDERLYSDTPYQLVEFTFSNVKGRTFKTSQL